MVPMVAAVLKHRLRPGGRALLCCAVREQVRSAPWGGWQGIGRRWQLPLLSMPCLCSLPHCFGIGILISMFSGSLCLAWPPPLSYCPTGDV